MGPLRSIAPMSSSTDVLPSTGGDRDLAVGHKVGEYVVEGKLGEGGFGTVYRAVHPLIGKQVAIKVLAPQYSAQPEMVSRFVAEARAVNQIRHRHIIDIFAFGELGDGRHYYVMELLDGETLDAHLKAAGRLALAEAVGILRAVGKALDAAHGKGIAHRDLKPENIFLVRDSDGAVFPKLLDFGIAKLLAAGSDSAGGLHKTKTGIPIGTPYYMSPEQCRGRDVDHRTDVYSFGVLAFELLTGQVPFAGDDYMEILLHHINDAPPRAGDLVADLSPTVDEALAWMMAKDPARRPPNLVTAVNALEHGDRDVALRATEPSGGQSAVYSAATRARSAQLGSAPTPTPGAMTPGLGQAATAIGDELRVAPPRRTGLWIGVGLAAVAAGVVAFVVARRGQGEGGAAATPPLAAVVADAAIGPALADATVAVATVAVDAAPALPTTVKLTITGTPSGTEVYGPRGPLGVAPGEIQLERGVETVLTFKADGYATTTRTVTVSGDEPPLEVVLGKRSGGKSGGGKSGGGKSGGGDSGGGKSGGGGVGGRDQIEDPFKSK